ncbi:Enhanced intracellular survival protein [[Actinomadura] parvosata subsp. kistnae]|uniref:GNAT family N-acetyltransferase n=1 Tax=[Actinomadura] parvosata subsp. kistnae TaxID=1909395 RepID=A0A1V0AHM6_9ACTN|nr:GNAT family N-acetyltransferase [Nonomuraea sp. ATCC 55076]AQZ69731.1 GNAT family N-acetyltransferase [Nonomuraea sp. ATCC 55076]SPL91543.1 Enhanced intracellular survival protein [Actinomadura parvosata subsp. kistnae]
MTYPIRPIDESEWTAFARVNEEAFGWTPHPQQAERYKAQTEFDRTLAAFDGDTIAGVTAVFSLTMTVPGRQLPVAGVTAVSVLASHRRRGVLSSLMRRQLNDIRERGESVAALYASESLIYGRYGYGRAASELSFTIDKHRSAFAPGAPQDPSLRLRVVVPAEVRGDLEKLFAAVVTRRPGRYERRPEFWDSVLADEEHDQRGNGPMRSIVAEDDHGVRGYALFRIKSSWDEAGIPNGTLKLQELEAADPAAYALLWRSVLDRDLVSKVETYGRPVDDPLIALLADTRQLRARWADELWVRLVEVDRALAERAYAAPVDVVIEVEDDVCPWNARRWRLTADLTGAECKPVDEEPDITLPVAALGSAYLGDGMLGEQFEAGLLREHSAGAVHRLATALSWSPKPWAGLTF